VTEIVKCSCGSLYRSQMQVCPNCGQLAQVQNPDVAARMVSDAREQLRAHVRSTDARGRDERMRGSVLRVGTMFCLGLAGVGVAALAAGYVVFSTPERRPTSMGAMSDQSDMMLVALIVTVVLVTVALVKLVRDIRAHTITRAGSARKALKRYVRAVLTGRTSKAYAAVAPSGRSSDGSLPAGLEKLAEEGEAVGFRDLARFHRYWKRVWKGPRGHGHYVCLARVDVQVERDGMVLCDVSYSYGDNLGAWTLLFGWVGILSIILTQFGVSGGQLSVRKMDVVKISKLMFRQDGEWYVAEGGIQGPLDMIPLEFQSTGELDLSFAPKYTARKG